MVWILLNDKFEGVRERERKRRKEEEEKVWRRRESDRICGDGPMKHRVQWVNVHSGLCGNAQVMLLVGGGCFTLCFATLWIMCNAQEISLGTLCGSLMIYDSFYYMTASSHVSGIEPVMTHPKG